MATIVSYYLMHAFFRKPSIMNERILLRHIVIQNVFIIFAI